MRSTIVTDEEYSWHQLWLQEMILWVLSLGSFIGITDDILFLLICSHQDAGLCLNVYPLHIASL